MNPVTRVKENAKVFLNYYWEAFKAALSFCCTYVTQQRLRSPPTHMRWKDRSPGTAWAKSSSSSCSQRRNVNKHLMHILVIWIRVRRIMRCVLWMLLYLNRSAYVSDALKSEIQLSSQDKQNCHEPPLRQDAVTKASVNRLTRPYRMLAESQIWVPEGIPGAISDWWHDTRALGIIISQSPWEVTRSARVTCRHPVRSEIRAVHYFCQSSSAAHFHFFFHELSGSPCTNSNLIHARI